MYVLPASAYRLLVPLYNSPDRHYHNLNHINFCLSKLQEYYNSKAINGNIEWNDDDEYLNKAVTLAIWFHDAIYSPYPSPLISNEVASQELFCSWLTEEYATKDAKDYIANYDLYSEVCTTIVLTEHHLHDLRKVEGELTLSAQLMLDIDLSGFAKPFNLVYKDSDLIFKEYACLGLSREVMLENRVKFLQNLLSKSQIFYTDYFYETHEAKARDNIQGVIELSLSELNK